jgi:hypothetical protein
MQCLARIVLDRDQKTRPVPGNFTEVESRCSAAGGDLAVLASKAALLALPSDWTGWLGLVQKVGAASTSADWEWRLPTSAGTLALAYQDGWNGGEPNDWNGDESDAYENYGQLYANNKLNDLPENHGLGLGPPLCMFGFAGHSCTEAGPCWSRCGSVSLNSRCFHRYTETKNYAGEDVPRGIGSLIDFEVPVFLRILAAGWAYRAAEGTIGVCPFDPNRDG